MDRARNDRQSLGIRASAVVVAAALVVGVIAMSTPASQAVAPATMPAVGSGGNGPTGYYPNQFVNQGAEIAAHIEAF